MSYMLEASGLIPIMRLIPHERLDEGSFYTEDQLYNFKVLVFVSFCHLVVWHFLFLVSILFGLNTVI